MAQTETKSSGQGSTVNSEQLAEQIETLKADVAALTETLRQLTRAKRDEAMHAARDRVHDAYAAGEAQVEALERRARALSDETSELVRRQPATALGVAAALGFLIGYVTSRD